MRSSWFSMHVLIFFAILVCSASSLGWAAGKAVAARPFTDLARPRAGGVIATAPRAVEELAASDRMRTKWEDFRRRHAGSWNVYVDERTGLPTLVSGGGIELFSAKDFEDVTRDEIEAAIRTFLTEHVDLLGDWSPLLELDAEASVKLGDDHWQVVFRQSVDGVQVENARLDFHVARGRLLMFGTSNWGMPTTRGVPAITANDARDFLDAYLDVATAHYEEVAKPELVLVALDAEPVLSRPRKWTGTRGRGLTHALVWRLRFRDLDGPALWVAEIDAHHGTVRAFYDGAHYAAVRGGVFPEALDPGCTAESCEIDGFPMPYADWAEGGQAQAYSDEFGNFTCADPSAVFETRLSGKYVTVDDNCGPVSQTAGCDGALRLGLQAGENCDVPYGASPGNTGAARSSYYHINRAAEVARSYNPDNAYLNGRVTVVSNWNQVCNASYSANQIYLYRSGTSWAECANTGEIPGIAVHEWGHGYDQNDGGGDDNTSEAYGDIVSMLAARASCFGPGLFTGGRVCSGYGDTCLTCTGFREHDWAARQANTPATPQVFVANNCGEGQGPCGGEVHCESYPIDESVWDLATRDLPAAGMDPDTAWQLTERLWYTTRAGSGGPIYTCALPDSDSCAASSWYQRMRVADDDDADLSNGTPHAAELYAAFARHNIACGLPADLANQSTSSCLPLATPAITVTGPSSGIEIGWGAITGAHEYVVYRGELGCHRQQVKVATVPAGTTSWLDDPAGSDLPRYYRVEAVGPNPVCRSAVSNCESSGGPRLQMSTIEFSETGAGGNGSGSLDPGETVQVSVTLLNGGSAEALGVSARLRTIDPSQGRVVEPVLSFADMAPLEAQASGAPHFEMTLFDDGVLCGEAVGLEITMNAEGAPSRFQTFSFELGEKERDYPVPAGLTLRRFNTNPVISMFEMTDDTIIGDLDVTVNIDHQIPGDLIVELSSPLGTTVRLHDQTPGADGIATRYDQLTDPDGPGTMADFEGESIAGTWTLSVRNTVFGGGSGTFQDWKLHVSSEGAFDCDALVCAEPPPGQEVDGFHVDRVVDDDDGSIDLAFSWSAAAGVPGYHVLQSTSVPFDGAIDLTGRTSGATTLTVENGAETGPRVTFFQVRSTNGCNEESP